MLVKSYMTANPVTVRPESDFLAAIAIMNAGRFHSLPVVTAEGKVVGILTDRDVAAALPPNLDRSQPRRPDYYGIKLTVAQAMNPDYVAVDPEAPLEEAALLMLQRRADRLLILEGDRLVGIISYTDIFRQLVAILGGGSSALRVTVLVKDKPGQLAVVAGAIASVKGNIISMATAGKSEAGVAFTLRIENIDWPTLQKALAGLSDVTVLHYCGPAAQCPVEIDRPG